MPTVTMPQLGESVAEGTIGKWLKQVGDHVELGEPIVEVVTDKVNAEVPSPFDGTLTQILVEEGQTVPNDADIAIIEAAGAAVAEAAVADAAGHACQRARARAAARAAPPPTPAPAAPASAAPPAPAAAVAVPVGPAVAVGDYKGRMTPAVRRLAREHCGRPGQGPRHRLRWPRDARRHPWLRGRERQWQRSSRRPGDGRRAVSGRCTERGASGNAPAGRTLCRLPQASCPRCARPSRHR